MALAVELNELEIPNCWKKKNFEKVTQHKIKLFRLLQIFLIYFDEVSRESFDRVNVAKMEIS